MATHSHLLGNAVDFRVLTKEMADALTRWTIFPSAVNLPVMEKKFATWVGSAASAFTSRRAIVRTWIAGSELALVGNAIADISMIIRSIMIQPKYSGFAVPS